MSSIRVTTNFRDNFGADLGTKLITKDYLMSVYPNIAQEIGKTPELLVGGNSFFGTLGVNDGTTRSTPVTTFAGGTNWKQVAAGGPHMAAIKTDGTLWVWGYNAYGQLGINAAGNRSTPITTFAGGTNWKQVSAGDGSCAAIKTDGTLWSWGRCYYGQLGNGVTTGNRSTPVTTFAGGTNWKQVSVMGSNMAAIKTDGTLWVWGRNNSAALGINASLGRSTPVTTFAGGTNWKQVVVGRSSNMLAIKTDGTLWSWGASWEGQLGNGVVTGNISTPVTTFAGGTNWKQVSISYGSVSGAIKTDGTLWVWGQGFAGRLGDAQTTTNKSTPITTFAGGTNWKQVSAGDKMMFAIKTDGTLWCWGENVNGEIGINASGVRSTPVTTFAGGTNWKQVSMSRDTFGAIRSADFI